MINGKKIKELRKAQRYSQALLAKKANICQTQLSKIELGKNNTTISTAEAIAGALGVKLEEIIIPDPVTGVAGKDKDELISNIPLVESKGDLSKLLIGLTCVFSNIETSYRYCDKSEKRDAILREFSIGNNKSELKQNFVKDAIILRDSLSNLLDSFGIRL